MRAFQKICRPFVVLLVCAVFGGLASCSLITGPGNDDEVDSSSVDTATMLRNLGITIAAESTRTDANGKTVDASVNPLGYGRTTLYKDCEVFASGVQRWDASTYWLAGSIFIGSSSGTLSGTDSDNSWTTFYNKSVAADMDGDGYDEVVAMYFNSASNAVILRELDYHAETFANKTSYSQTVAYPAFSMQDRQSIAGGDIDGDGYPEILVTNSNLLLIYDNAYSLLYAEIITSQSDEQHACVRVECADFDGDGKDEIVLINGNQGTNTIAQGYIYDWSGNSLSLVEDFLVSNGTYSLTSADLVSGDFDGDGLPEIAFGGYSFSRSAYYLLVMDTSMDSNSNCRFAMLSTVGAEFGYHWFPPVAAGDLDKATDASGNFRDEIVCLDDIWKLDASGELELFKADAIQVPYPDMLAVGDIDGDKMADIVSCNQENLIAYKIDATGAVSALFNADCYYDYRMPGSVCLPDIDHDSSVLRYVDHKLQYTDPRIIAVIASPPYWSNIDQNTDDTSLEYGLTSGSGVSTENSVGFSVSASQGVSLDCPLWGSAGSLEAKWTITNAFTWSFNNSKDITMSVGYASSPGEDKVVFTAIPFDVYYYEIVSSPDGASSSVSYNPNSPTYTVISVPRGPEVLSVSREFYNANNGDGPDVDSSILSSTPGNPFSYPTYSQRTAAKASCGNVGLFSTNDANHYLTVGQGNSYQTLSIEELTTESSSFDYTLSIDYEVEVVTLSLLSGRGLGFEYGYSYSSSVSSGTYVALSLGDISNAGDYNSATKFKTGLMAYPVEAADDQSFTLVTCWVDQ